MSLSETEHVEKSEAGRVERGLARLSDLHKRVNELDSLLETKVNKKKWRRKDINMIIAIIMDDLASFSTRILDDCPDKRLTTKTQFFSYIRDIRYYLCQSSDILRYHIGVQSICWKCKCDVTLRLDSLYDLLNALHCWHLMDENRRNNFTLEDWATIIDGWLPFYFSYECVKCGSGDTMNFDNGTPVWFDSGVMRYASIE